MIQTKAQRTADTILMIMALLSIMALIAAGLFFVIKKAHTEWWTYTEVKIQWSEETGRRYALIVIDGDVILTSDDYERTTFDKMYVYKDTGAPIEALELVHKSATLFMKDGKLYIRTNPFNNYFGGRPS
jgi:hypothetical protein